MKFLKLVALQNTCAAPANSPSLVRFSLLAISLMSDMSIFPPLNCDLNFSFCSFNSRINLSVGSSLTVALVLICLARSAEKEVDLDLFFRQIEICALKPFRLL